MMTIIGCGNLNRCDDGVGVVVAHRLMAYVERSRCPGVCVFDAGTGGMEIMFRARGAEKLVLIDANRSGSDPGAIFRVPGSELAHEHQPSYSLHDFRWDHALYAGRRIFGASFPTDVTVFLIEAGNLGFGCELTAPVSQASDRVAREIESMIDQHVGAVAP